MLEARQEADRLDGLSQPHLIGEDSTYSTQEPRVQGGDALDAGSWDIL